MNIVLQLLYSYIITRCSQKSYYESNYLQEIIRIASPSPKPLVHPSPNPSRSTDSSTHCGIRFRISTFSSSTFESFEKKNTGQLVFWNILVFFVLVVIQKLISVVQMSWNLGGWLTLLKKSHRLEHLADGITWQVKEVFKRNLWSGRFDDVSCCSCVHDKWISYSQSKFIICHCHQSFLYVHRVCKITVFMPSKRNIINICHQGSSCFTCKSLHTVCRMPPASEWLLVAQRTISVLFCSLEFVWILPTNPLNFSFGHAGDAFCLVAIPCFDGIPRVQPLFGGHIYLGLGQRIWKTLPARNIEAGTVTWNLGDLMHKLSIIYMCQSNIKG